MDSSGTFGHGHSLLNSLHASEIPLVLATQRDTPFWFENALGVYTEWINPAMVLPMVVPFLIALRLRASAIHLLVVACVADLLNLVLKWSFSGDRPYWASSLVRQFPMTCEGGFGMPSGHMHAFAAVTFFLMCRFEVGTRVYVVQAGLSLVGAYSRVITGSHFPSQTIVGWLIGTCCGVAGHRLLSSSWASAMSGRGVRRQKRFFVGLCFTAICFATVLICFAFLTIIGHDPLASRRFALAACHSERGVVGLTFESFAKIIGILLGASVLITVLPCGDVGKIESISLLQGVKAIAYAAVCMLLSGWLGRRSDVFKDGPDGMRSIAVSLCVGVCQAVLVGMFEPLAHMLPIERNFCKKLR
eukprot:TRINITY_DN57938_c0_g1_i1.p1 TRINITY_DN57938_c0_g1~~TRINITY_DN57938_c0_g1_i1.p1  ORF type:complete len:378 (+),score=40.14 TRINITY_DN57938_c0_g1_i1:60-1136(+)